MKTKISNTKEKGFSYRRVDNINLGGTKFSRADLRGANLSRADLRGAKLRIVK